MAEELSSSVMRIAAAGRHEHRDVSLTVVVATFNGAARLGRTLRALASQEFGQDVRVEFVLVDNRSTDGSAEFVAAEWAACGGAAKFGPWRVVEELTPGSAFARRAGMRVATGEIVLLCDDDNELAPD